MVYFTSYLSSTINRQESRWKVRIFTQMKKINRFFFIEQYLSIFEKQNKNLVLLMLIFIQS